MTLHLTEGDAIPLFRSWAAKLDTASRVRRLGIEFPESMRMGSVVASIKSACRDMTGHERKIRDVLIASSVRELEDSFGLEQEHRLKVAEVLA